MDSNAAVVVAIDLGTTYSGCFFSMRTEPSRFYHVKHLNGGLEKVPTSLLLNENQSFNSFGIKAEEQYITLAVENKHDAYYFFRNFKMDLHFKILGRDSVIEDIAGKPLTALTVFSLSIEFLKNHCLQAINDIALDGMLHEDHFKYVLTVPAIWSDRSKRFMRAAANKAGIPDSQLVLALEPEAASIFCQKVSVDYLLSGENKDLHCHGQKYLIADIGGGTADFAVHEVNKDGSLKELYRASGGPHGGIYVDKEFLKLCELIFGNGAIEDLKRNEIEEYLSMLSAFENKKRHVTSDNSVSLKIRVAVTLNSRRSEKEKKDAIKTHNLEENVSLITDKLNLKPEVMKGFFTASLNSIVKHVRKIIEAIPDIRYILLVGGYSASSLLQETIKQEFDKRLKIIIPQESYLSVVKGAVLFGHNPQYITERRLRFSYGVASQPIFDHSIHPRKRCFLDNNGVSRCKDAFKVIKSKGTEVRSSGVIVTRSTSSLYKSQKSCSLRVYCTEEDNPVIIDETCTHLGTLQIFAPPNNSGLWTAEHNFVFGMTELRIYATVTEAEESYETTLDLLE